MKIIITESQLKYLIPEQETQQQIKAAIRLYPCLPKKYKYPTHTVLNNLDDKGDVTERMVGLALGVIGRESSFESGKRWFIMSAVKNAMDTIGLTPSLGPAQMTKATAEMVGMTIDEIKEEVGALRAVILLLNKLYKKALSIGYTKQKSNVKNGTGDAAMDYAIMAYNGGISTIKKYCESVDPERKKKNLKTPCDKIKDPSKRVVVKNYIPNLHSTRKDFVDTWSHGYIGEVAQTAKEKLACFPKVGVPLSGSWNINVA